MSQYNKKYKKSREFNRGINPEKTTKYQAEETVLSVEGLENVNKYISSCDPFMDDSTIALLKDYHNNREIRPEYEIPDEIKEAIDGVKSGGGLWAHMVKTGYCY